MRFYDGLTRWPLFHAVKGSLCVREKGLTRLHCEDVSVRENKQGEELSLAALGRTSAQD